jgi:type I restriction enzyme S subunit
MRRADRDLRLNHQKGEKMKEDGRSIPLAEWVKPRTEKALPADFPDEPFLGLDDVEAHTTRLLGSKPSKSMKSAAKRFYPGDVLYSRLRPYLNKVWLADRSGLCSSEFIVFPPTGNLDGAFLKYRLNARDFVSFANSLNAGDRPRVDFDQISAFCLPPFSLGYQRKLVARIEELFSELDAGEESLRAARRQLGVYRQSLLKQAFEGKLTETWRAENPDKLESPAQLHARIQAARQARYEQELKAWNADPRELKKPRAPKASIPLSEESRRALPDLPSQWSWVTLGDIADTTVGFAFKSQDFKSEGIRLLRGDNIEPRRLRWTNAVRWPESSLHEYRDLLVSEGDIILAMDRPVISSGLKVAMARATDVPCLLVQRVARITGCCGIENKFLIALIDQQRFINHCLGHQTGTQLPHISESQIRAFPVPLCPLPEQQEIVRLLDEQFEAIERNEREIDAALKRSEALRQAILKKAFTGQLVPQDPTDEPASTLLAHIRKNQLDESSSRRRRAFVIK